MYCMRHCSSEHWEWHRAVPASYDRQGALETQSDDDILTSKITRGSSPQHLIELLQGPTGTYRLSYVC